VPLHRSGKQMGGIHLLAQKAPAGGLTNMPGLGLVAACLL
jgi:hypothetical protein